MPAVDLAILIALAGVPMLMGWLGYRPAKADDARAKRRHEVAFIVLALLGVALVVVQQSRNYKSEKAAEHERKILVLGSEQRIRAEQLKFFVETRYILLNANMDRSGGPDLGGAKVTTRLRQLSNSDLRALVAERVALVRAVVTTYNSTALALRREHLQALERAWRLENPDMHDESAMMAYVDRVIARLGNPEFFRNRERTVGEAVSVDPLWGSEDVNAFYVELERRNLGSMIASFQSSRAQAYGAELLSRLPAGTNVQIKYNAVPVSPSQISAIADDLERLAKRLPTK